MQMSPGSATENENHTAQGVGFGVSLPAAGLPRAAYFEIAARASIAAAIAWTRAASLAPFASA